MTALFSNLKHGNVVILGGGSGIGAAVARAAIAYGASLVVAGRNHSRLDALAQSLRTHAKAHTTDITDANALRALFNSLGTVDHLVITSGPMIGSSAFSETDIKMGLGAFDVKFWGAVRAVQATLSALKPKASITLTSGFLARKAVQNAFIKASMSAAVESLGSNLAKEMAPRRVNVLSSGVTDTEAYANLSTEVRLAMFERIGKTLPVGRIGREDEIASAYLMLMSNHFMTGTVIDVECGGLL